MEIFGRQLAVFGGGGRELDNRTASRMILTIHRLLQVQIGVIVRLFIQALPDLSAAAAAATVASIIEVQARNAQSRVKKKPGILMNFISNMFLEHA